MKTFPAFLDAMREEAQKSMLRSRQASKNNTALSGKPVPVSAKNLGSGLVHVGLHGVHKIK